MRIAEAGIRRVFHVSLWLKGLHSLAEVVGGLTLVFLSHELIARLATALTRADLMEDPRDLVANALRQTAEGFTTDAQSSAAWPSSNTCGFRRPIPMALSLRGLQRLAHFEHRAVGA